MSPFRNRRRAGLAVLLGVSVLFSAACGNDASKDRAAGTVADTREVASANGPVTIPTQPERIVTDWATFDNLVSLGFDLKRVAGIMELSWFLDNPTLSPRLTQAAKDAGIAAAPARYEPDFEALAKLRPDVILVAEDQAPRDGMDKYQAIAPVLAYKVEGGGKSFESWKGALRATASVLGGEYPTKAADYIGAFERRAAAFKTEQAAKLRGLKVSLGGASEDGLWLSLGDRNIGTNVIKELGLVRPAAQTALQPDEYGSVQLSHERMAVLDADILFLELRQEKLGVLETNPLWKGLSVVKNKRYHLVGNYWEFGSAGAANDVLTDIIRAITG